MPSVNKPLSEPSLIWPVFCLLLRVSSDYAQPITGDVTEVTCPVIGQAQPELTPSKRQKTGPDLCPNMAQLGRNELIPNRNDHKNTTKRESCCQSLERIVSIQIYILYGFWWHNNILFIAASIMLPHLKQDYHNHQPRIRHMNRLWWFVNMIFHMKLYNASITCFLFYLTPFLTHCLTTPVILFNYT